MSEGIDGDPQLGEVLDAVGAVGEMALEAVAVAPAELAVEVRRHQRDRLATHEGATPATPQLHQWALPSSAVSNSRKRARPRWRSTRWFPAVMPRSVATALGSRPSTSRSTTTWRCWSLRAGSR